jgi:hypothetical protein
MTVSDDQEKRWLVRWAFFGGWANNPLIRGKPKPKEVYRDRFDTYDEATRFAREMVASYGLGEVAFAIIDLAAKQPQPPATSLSFASDWPLQRRPPPRLAEMLKGEGPQ